MCSRHAEPGAGAPISSLDIGCREPGCFATWTASEEHVHERPYRVLVRLHDGDRIPLTVSAIGPKGARATALEVARQKGLDPESVVFIEAAA